MAQKFNILTKQKDLYTYIYQATAKSPVKFHDDLPSILRVKINYILELIIRANNLSKSGQIIDKPERLKLQKEILIQLQIIEELSDNGVSLNILTNKQLEQIVCHCEELVMMIDNWIESDKKR